MNEWIIIGGGIHGITLATFLLKSGKTTTKKLKIIDRNAEPLANWKRNTDVISMPYLRSPSVHHIDADPFSLQSFVKLGSYSSRSAFYGQYKRPSLQLFNDHCEHVINDLSLKDTWIQGCAQGVLKTADGWELQLKDGREIYGKRLVLAIGFGNQLKKPDWAIEIETNYPRQIFHVFDETLPKFDELNLPITIIGGGITSIHLAIKLSMLYPKQVTLLKRHPFRIHDFDSDPGWLGPKRQTAFRNIENYPRRRMEIINARNLGSFPHDLYIKLLNLIKTGALILKEGNVVRAEVKLDEIHLFDKDSKFLSRSGTVLLATGFLPSLPESEWIKPIINTMKLPCAECGYPIVSEILQWAPDLYVMGGLAELEIGPIARNISGARQAAERIVNHI